MKLVKNFLDRLKVSKDGVSLNSEKLTNKRLLEELTSNFKSMLEDESVGQKMLYPMSFNILMDPADYNNRIQSLPFVLPQVVSAFYGIIDDMRHEYPDYTPPAEYWYFQFSACRLGTIFIDDITSIEIKRGNIKTIATLWTYDCGDNENNVSVENNIRISIKLQNSNVYSTFNVNKAAITNMDILGDGIFKCKFDNNLSNDVKRITDNFNFAEINGIAELSYSIGGHNHYFCMKDNLLHISGKNEMRESRSILILESPNIKDSHVQIKYLPSEKKFQIAAYGLTRVNERKIIESSGGDVYWHDLANNSSIFINDEIKVKFKIK